MNSYVNDNVKKIAECTAFRYFFVTLQPKGCFKMKIEQIYDIIEEEGFTAQTLQTIDNYIKEIQNGTEDFPRFNLSEHAGFCTAGAPLIGASIIASYATASITASCHVEGCDGGLCIRQMSLLTK